MLITDMAVFEFDKVTRKMTLTEIAEDTTVEAVKENTGCDFAIASNLKRF